jgi:hypothetical protein
MNTPMEEKELSEKYDKAIMRKRWTKTRQQFLMDLCKALKLNPQEYIEDELSPTYFLLKNFCLKEFMHTPNILRPETFAFMYLLSHPSSPQEALDKYNSIKPSDTKFPSFHRYAQNACAKVIPFFETEEVQERFKEVLRDAKPDQEKLSLP